MEHSYCIDVVVFKCMMIIAVCSTVECFTSAVQLIHAFEGSETMSLCFAECFQPEDQAPHVNGCQVIVALRYGGRVGGRVRLKEVLKTLLSIKHYASFGASCCQRADY